jgi:mutator family transposase
MEAEVSDLTGVPHGERDPDHRLTHRNGYRERRWDTRVGTIDLAIPRVRDGSYFPSLLEPRRRAERALLAVVQESRCSSSSACPTCGTRSTGPPSSGTYSPPDFGPRLPDSQMPPKPTTKARGIDGGSSLGLVIDLSQVVVSVFHVVTAELAGG